MSEPPADEVWGWVTSEDVAALWPRGVTDVDEDALPIYLNAAHTQCLDYLRRPGATIAPHDSLKTAQVAQARQLARLFTVGDGGTLTAIDGGPTVFPMDWTVKLLLRPWRKRRGGPR